ncbi:unnamed protein product [Arctia plantaginis]|uniref:Chemosensory protein n=1 Tax=Arctia plantaginis TaxID=874455 RepID=A0A8S0ZQ99_ARCPL|nr:unnamed protein product [Arctia plantaginis]
MNTISIIQVKCSLGSTNMKLLIVLALVALAVAHPHGDHYNTKYESIDVDVILESDRLTKAYINCFTNKAKCTTEGTEIKSYIPDAINSSCAKCTEKQKKLTAKFIKGIQSKYADDYAVLYKIHDPEAKNGEELKKFLNTYGA